MERIEDTIDGGSIPNDDANMEGFNLLERSLPGDIRRSLNLSMGKLLNSLRSESKIMISEIGRADFSIRGVLDNIEEDEKLVLGCKLGQGGFSSVYGLQSDPRVACKFLSNSSLQVEEGDTLQERLRCLKIASEDIVREHHFLSALEHPNIISVKGVGSLDDMGSYYLLLEKICMPLTEKLKDWELARVDNGLLQERMVYALQIASAFTYLHSSGIIYRDLKIDNLGLNEEGQILVYDFGLAKELKNSPCENGKYKLSGGTGSWAYMAPEVAKHYRYNQSVDVYSYGIVLWEIFAGRYAYATLTQEAVLGKSEQRPPLVQNWPSDLEELLSECWHWNPNRRPTFPEIELRLQETMEKEFPKKKGFFRRK